jgi:hypothetical protein
MTGCLTKFADREVFRSRAFGYRKGRIQTLLLQFGGIVNPGRFSYHE